MRRVVGEITVATLFAGSAAFGVANTAPAIAPSVSIEHGQTPAPPDFTPQAQHLAQLMINDGVRLHPSQEKGVESVTYNTVIPTYAGGMTRLYMTTTTRSKGRPIAAGVNFMDVEVDKPAPRSQYEPAGTKEAIISFAKNPDGTWDASCATGIVKSGTSDFQPITSQSETGQSTPAANEFLSSTLRKAVNTALSINDPTAFSGFTSCR